QGRERGADLIRGDAVVAGAVLAVIHEVLGAQVQHRGLGIQVQLVQPSQRVRGIVVSDVLQQLAVGYV
ncbi:hypothetical protein EY02_14825, partial [Staphylococcus aureus]